ncbi:MAG TPA: toll/interleukin-1 receptor domain-containing protein, partial [Thermoanaerobaculia bacterium]|nr:toll/interleukin-1 receptor domain-containing protein [Thermoanaerobaculia bacterium]
RSNWVEAEIRSARKQERSEGRQILFPLRLVTYEDLKSWELFNADEGRDLAAELREYFIPDFSEWQESAAYRDALEQLLKGLVQAG